MPEGGRIVNIGSIHSVLRPVGASIYTATKVACEAFAAVLSKELAPRGITVNTLGLSPTDTDMYRSLSETARQKFLAMLPIPRLATPEDICNAIDFFCSPASGMVTGQTIYLGGIA
jgi:3-oxoacyl-[acyl-carrier protein] reductase